MRTEQETHSSSPAELLTDTVKPSPFVRAVEAALEDGRLNVPHTSAEVAYLCGEAPEPGTPDFEQVGADAVRTFERNLLRYERPLAARGIYWQQVGPHLIITNGQVPDGCLATGLLALMEERGAASLTLTASELAAALFELEWGAWDFTPAEVGAARNAESKLLRGLGLTVEPKKARGHRRLEVKLEGGMARLEELLEGGTS